MPQIAENGNESLEENCDQSRILANEDGNSKFCIPSFTSEIWESSSFNAPKTESDDEIMFSTSNGLESQVHNKVCGYTFNQMNFELFSTVLITEYCCHHPQESDFGYQNLGLTHHQSLPSSSTKMSSIQRFLEIQGSVPCKIRAKRGFATHPRSIAERVKFYNF